GAIRDSFCFCAARGLSWRQVARGSGSVMDRAIIRPRVTCVVAESCLLSGGMAPELFSLYRDRANPGHAGFGYVCGKYFMGGSRLAQGLTLMALANRCVLYISYNGMLDPLGQSQVIPYLKELSKLGVRFTLLS